jgi:hypothetical protein
MKRRAMKGRFDMKLLEVNIQLSEDPSDTTTIGEFIEDYNRSIIKTLNYDPETGECELDQAWVDEIRPVLIEIFSERGWGMSKELYVITEVAEDILKKGSALIANRMVLSGILKVAEQQLDEQKEANRINRRLLEKAEKQQTANPTGEVIESVEIVSPQVKEA